jgi:tetratricopeptide (TPR) repeat protein
MKGTGFKVLLGIAFFCISVASSAQEEESAELSLIEYTDEFQELFFEALKQKGIENYDKAINLLLKCKQLSPNNSVVDHELAKAYGLNNELVLGEQYAITALNAEPTSLWYLHTLVELLQKQGSDLDAISNKIPYDAIQLKENLALIYFQKKEYESALDITKQLRSSTFAKELSLKIRDSISLRLKETEAKEKEVEVTESLDPLAGYNKQIVSLIDTENFEKLIQTSEEALEMYPSQPYYYYAAGLALNKLLRPEEAVEMLQMGLDYLLDDEVLAQKIYKELALGYTALGDTEKATMYLSKIKNGS